VISNLKLSPFTFRVKSLLFCHLCLWTWNYIDFFEWAPASTIESISTKYIRENALRTIRTSDYSYPGLFVLWVDYSYLGRFVQWTIRTTDFSYYGLFVPSVKYSHNINCWCKGVPPGAHPPGWLSNASRPRCQTSYLYVKLWHFGYFLVIIAKPTSCYYFVFF